MAFASILASITLAACSDTAADPGRLDPEQGLQNAAAIIEVAPAEAHVETAGETVDLAVELRDKKGRVVKGRLVTWTSLQPSVARVENSGRVTTLTKGEAVVLATVDGLVDTARVFVKDDPPPAAVIEIAQAGATIPAVGASITLAVHLRDAQGRPILNPTIFWESLNPEVATVSSSGQVFGLTQGVARIVARYGVLSDTAEVTVAAATSAMQLEIVPELASVAVGATTPLSVTLRTADGGMMSATGVTWESSNPVVASVNSAGLVTGVNAGVAQILARHGELEATSVVQVGGAGQPAQVLIGTDSDTIPAIGAVVSLTAVVVDSEGNEVPSAAIKWVSLDPSVAVVGNGSVAGVQKGIGRVAARHGALADTATLWVAPAPPTATASALTISPAVDTIPSIGGQASLTAAVFNAQSQPIAGKAIAWTSLDIDVAEVDANGVVTSSAKGVARIVASHGALADTSLVHVEPLEHVEEDPGSGDDETDPTFTVVIDPANDTIPQVGATLLFEVGVLDATGKIVPNAEANWTVLNPSVLSLSATSQTRTTNGTAKAAGTTSVVATYGTFADTATVTVAKAATSIQPVAVRISPQDDSIANVGGSTTLTASIYDAQGNAIANGKASWTSLDPSVASVGTAGQTSSRLITGLARGSARITATASGVTDTAIVHVLAAATGGTAPTISVSHSPDNPTTANAVTISGTSSDPAAVASMTLSVDGTVVKSCSSGTCSYSSQLAAGPHTYSASAVDATGKALNTGPVNFTVWLAPSGGGSGSSTYSPTSPHWRHMRTSTVDYRIHYQKGAQQAAEYDWAAGHFDHVTGGTLNQYKSRNGTIKHFPYDTYWFVPVANAGAAENWLTANGYNVENAYLHVAGTSKTKANRILKQQFLGRDYWYYNMGDPGFQAWRRHTTRQQVAVNSQGYASDGLFFDTNSRATVRKYVPAVTLEYGSYAEYYLDFDALLSSHRGWVSAGYVILNQSTYFNKAEELDLSKVAGGTMLEFVNGPYRDPQWAAVDQALSNGTVVEYGTAIKANHKGNLRYGVTRGNYQSITERVLMWEYASYLMVVDPSRMDQLYFEPYLGSWDTPMNSVWLKAYEHDIGLATGRRNVMASGKDGAGQTYQVYQRDFENALVLIRPSGSKGSSGTYDFGEASAVTVNLPSGTWRMLLADGTVTGPVTSVKIRCGEAVIFVK